MSKKKSHSGPKILFIDIETAPILAHTWSIWNVNIGLNQIVRDWSILSFAAKWDHQKNMMYYDQRKEKDIFNDKKLVQKLWLLLNEADILVTQNGDSFDIKKINARLLFHGFPPPSSYKRIDTKKLAKKNFSFTSNKLEYMTEKFNKTYKKLSHNKYPGMALWTECLKGTKGAWKEMERYNKHDVLSLIELYNKLITWDSTINFSLYHDDEDHVCSCGSHDFTRNGFAYTSTGKFQRFVCVKCNKESRSKENLFSVEKKKSLHSGIPR